MIEAPSCSERYAVSAISSGVTGTCVVSFFRGTEPVGATVMMSFSMVRTASDGWTGGLVRLMTGPPQGRQESRLVSCTVRGWRLAGAGLGGKDRGRLARTVRVLGGHEQQSQSPRDEEESPSKY